ncbi:DUF2188 domain-containing protein [Macrococcoides bohemicum]|uniref:DUF2188 domain-containing protein n=1 Tax=Macrococcoides bohemicum TaxID=1903056 RepID=UPI00105A3E65|nr:DUF2188 domain-containing protein [Macrococcus bohemicus]TDL40588.1 DUF2188 domain-containing protein [Macrococcus bohemicus]
MTKKNVHITQTDKGDWQVKRAGGQKASSTHKTQAEAIDAGRKIAKRDGVENVIHGKDGKIRAKDSYGNDPHPPKG